MIDISAFVDVDDGLLKLDRISDMVALGLLL
jgi:hypothetical protein